MKLKPLSIILIPTLIISLLSMIPINRSYSKDDELWMSKDNDDTR